MRINNKIFWSWLSWIVSIALWGCTVQAWAMGERPTVVEKLRLGAYEGDVGALAWIAKDNGFFDKVALSVDIQGYASGKAATDALKAGQVDVATAAEFVFASLTLADDKLRILGNVCHYRNKAMLGRKDRGIAVPSDLRGKRVGVTVPSGAEYSLYVFLAQNGLSLRDITQVPLNPKELVEALAAGRIDAALTWQPHVQTLEQQMGKAVVTFPGDSYDQFLLLIAASDFTRTQASALRKLMAGLLLAEDWVLKHPAEAKHYLATRFKLTPDYVAMLWPQMRLTMNFPQELMTALDGEASWLVKRKSAGAAAVPGLPNYATFIQPEFLKFVRPEAVTVITR